MSQNAVYNAAGARRAMFISSRIEAGSPAAARRLKAVIFSFMIGFVFASSAGAGIFSHEKDITAIFEDYEVNGPDRNTVGELENYVEKNPQGEASDEALFRLGYVYSQRKDRERAAQTYQRLIEGFPASRLKFDALYELGNLKYRSGGLKDAKDMLEAVSSSREAGAGVKARARVLLREINSSYSDVSQDVPAIGALLPLKGSYSQFAEDALNGILIAADVFGGKGAPFEVIVKNTGSDASEIEAAVSELALNQRVVGIVGPLAASTSLEAARQAQNKKIPMITLSQKEGVTQSGDYIFRNSLTPPSQAAAIAAYAAKKIGVKRVAVLYPQNNYGTELAKLFEKEIKEEGVTVVRELSYPQGTKDFSDHVKRLFGVQVKEHREGRRRIKEFNPTVNADAVYIPDFYDSVALIAPYLEYYNIKGVQLLGSNGWNSAKLAQSAGKNVEGAVFVDGFFPASQRPGTEEFTGRFKEVYGHEPGILEAQAYDSARILITAAGDGKDQRPERENVKARLRAVRDFRGAVGSMSFDARGEAVKRLFILTVRDGRIVEAPGS